MFEFKSFSSIERFKGLQCIVTEKIHGTNAQIHIIGDEIRAAGRNRYLTIEHDNYGFALWVEHNKKDLIEFFGEGRHYGEWYGLGINSGYGLKEKRFASFGLVLKDKPNRPPQVEFITELYNGKYDYMVPKQMSELLLHTRSMQVPGFDKPEGIVINFPALGHRFKMVFDLKDSAWCAKKPPREKIDYSQINIDHLLKIEILENVLSKDEQYKLLYPHSLSCIVSLYVADIKDEEYYKSSSENELYHFKKSVFRWVKSQME